MATRSKGRVAQDSLDGFVQTSPRDISAENRATTIRHRGKEIGSAGDVPASVIGHGDSPGVLAVLSMVGLRSDANIARPRRVRQVERGPTNAMVGLVPRPTLPLMLSAHGVCGLRDYSMSSATPATAISAPPIARGLTRS